MQLIEVRDKKSNEAFYQIWKRIYANDPNYIPHIRQDLEKIFDPTRNKLFKSGGKCIRWILQDARGETIGRVAAFIHPKTAFAGPHKVGGMGFFECIEDASAAFKLMDACREWLIAQGMEGMEGPVNFGERDQFWGLLVENFTAMPSYGMNYNPPYYREFFETYGFRNYFDQLVFWRDMRTPAQEIFVKKSNMIQNETGFQVRNMRGVPTLSIADYFLEVYNSAWGGFAGFKPMRLEQARNIIKAMKVIMDRDILIFAFMNDKPIGFYLNIPELNEFFRHVNGNMNWWGKLKFIYHLKFSRRKTMLGIVFGVSREFQGRGVEGAMIKFAGDTIVPSRRYEDTILTWIGDFNPRMLKVIENLDTKLHRKLSTYRLFFDPSIPFERHPIVGSSKQSPDKQQETNIPE